MGKRARNSVRILKVKTYEEKCLLWTGEVQGSRMPFWEREGPPFQ